MKDFLYGFVRAFKTDKKLFGNRKTRYWIMNIACSIGIVLIILGRIFTSDNVYGLGLALVIAGLAIWIFRAYDVLERDIKEGRDIGD